MVGDGGLDEVARAVQLVAPAQLDEAESGLDHLVVALQVAVVLLGFGQQADHQVHVLGLRELLLPVRLRQLPGGGLQPLGHIGVEEGQLAPVLAGRRPGGQPEVVQIAHGVQQGRALGDAHLGVDASALVPEPAGDTGGSGRPQRDLCPVAEPDGARCGSGGGGGGRPRGRRKRHGDAPCVTGLSRLFIDIHVQPAPHRRGLRGAGIHDDAMYGDPRGVETPVTACRDGNVDASTAGVGRSPRPGEGGPSYFPRWVWAACEVRVSGLRDGCTACGTPNGADLRPEQTRRAGHPERCRRPRGRPGSACWRLPSSGAGQISGPLHDTRGDALRERRRLKVLPTARRIGGLIVTGRRTAHRGNRRRAARWRFPRCTPSVRPRTRGTCPSWRTTWAGPARRRAP